MGMMVMPPSLTEKSTLRKMGRNDNEGKTPSIGIKNLEKIRPHTAIIFSQGEMIQTRNLSFMRHQEVSEDHQSSNPKNALPATGQGNITKRACLPPYPGLAQS